MNHHEDFRGLCSASQDFFFFNFGCSDMLGT